MSDATIEVTAFDRLSEAAARALLAPVCASGAWLDAMVAGRPFGTRDSVIARSDVVLAGLAWSDVLAALAAHPRIGERAAGESREAQWSRQEQAAAVPDDELVAGNVEYEHRFGHVFLICATGRTSGEILAALRDRLGNDPEAEQAVVRTELAAIVRLRVTRTIA